MSHNYSYRRPPPPAKDLRASAFDSPDHLHPGDHSHNVYRSSQEAPSHSTIPSYPSSSSRASAATESPYSFSLSQSDPYSSLSRSDPHSSSLSRSDQTLTLLSSCGLEPKDLSLLAEMPEELITVENLPRLLLEIRKKRATQQPPYPAMTSYPPAATSRPPTATPPPGHAWEQRDQSRSQPLDYPHPALPPSQLLPTEQAEPWQLDRHGNPMQYTGSRLEPVPVRVVDYHYGKETPRIYQTPRSTYNTAQGGSSNTWKPPNSSQPAVDYRYPPPTDYRPRPDKDVPVVPIMMATSGKTPTKKAALDFHGEIPQTFPYSCSLCDITVLSEKFWFTHVNGTQHADGQLALLQMYPEWDCRMQTARSGDNHTDRPRVEEKTAGPSHRSINYLGKPSSSGSRKNVDTKTKVTKGSGKVVCAKFTARCLNEDGLKDLINPFGEVVKVIMFPTLLQAFVEMGSTDQAADIVTYYLSNPVMVKGGRVTFSVSSTFNFLQSSRVLSFSPVPPGKESAAWKRELLAVAEGFGPVKHSLFLPTQAFVEMTNALDAQKLVGHHTSKHLKIDEMHIKVAFSSEYNTLRTMSERKSSDRKSSDRSRKSEDRSKRKRTPSPRRRSLSPRRDSPISSKRRRRSRERDSDRHKERAKSNFGGKNRPKSPSKQSSSRSPRSLRSHTKERVSSEKVSPISSSTRSQPPTKNKTPSRSSTVMEKSKKAVDAIDQSKQETATHDSQEDGAMEACDMDSDIEGMAVYGEDGEENSDMGEVGEGEEREELQESAEDLIQEFKDLCEPRQKATSGTVDDAPTEELSATGSEQGKELSAPVSEQGKELSASRSEQGKELSATGSEQGKELSATGSEQGKELSATGSEQGKELSATGSEQGKELSATGSEQGKELSATGSEQGKELSATGSEQGKELSATGSEQGKSSQRPGQNRGKSSQRPGQNRGKSSQRPGQNRGKSSQRPGQNRGKSSQRPGQNRGKSSQRPGQNRGKSSQRPGQNRGKSSQRPGQNRGKRWMVKTRKEIFHTLMMSLISQRTLRILLRWMSWRRIPRLITKITSQQMRSRADPRANPQDVIRHLVE
ncbi:matrin-3-like isoform X1 [Oncorhynchus keta]|uniref:matrin-3-like isoform X1 n=1 Tax=Oncorhynchus keta TaxID=8018 RepID=UPI00227C64CC|nr:matrin-3-like isoform X1 [Oncorhynchus keta]XP_052373128.1 matrin-3-like isoform X1 [Oncorhynchus keta]